MVLGYCFRFQGFLFWFQGLGLGLFCYKGSVYRSQGDRQQKIQQPITSDFSLETQVLVSHKASSDLALATFLERGCPFTKQIAHRSKCPVHQIAREPQPINLSLGESLLLRCNNVQASTKPFSASHCRNHIDMEVCGCSHYSTLDNTHVTSLCADPPKDLILELPLPPGNQTIFI